MTYRVLVADPNKTVRLAAQMVFAKNPEIFLATAINAFEALDKMHTFGPVLAFLDANLAKELQAGLVRPPCPIIILNKPFTSKGLEQQVEDQLIQLACQAEQ